MNIIIVPLTGTLAPSGKLKLNDSVYLIPTTVEIRSALDRPQFHRVGQSVANSAATLIIESFYPTSDPAAEAKASAEENVLRLRLALKGDIGMAAGFIDTIEWLAAPSARDPARWFAAYHYVVWHRQHHSTTADFRCLDDDERALLFEEATGRELMKEAAFRFFFRAYHEPYATDRFLSNAIGLEALLMRGDSDTSNLSYKFRDRGAFALSQSPHHAPISVDELYSRLGKLYSARSKIAHGGLGDSDFREPADIQLLTDAEAYLRSRLLLYLSSSNLQDAAALDRAKRSQYRLGE